MSTKAQALAFLAGTNSIFVGDRLLGTANRGLYRDAAMFETLGLVAAPSPSA
jgi:biotin synthase